MTDPTAAPDAALSGSSDVQATVESIAKLFDAFRAFSTAYPRASGFLFVVGVVAILVGAIVGWIDPVKAEKWNVRAGAVVRIARRLGVVLQGSGPLWRQLVSGTLAFPEQHRPGYREGARVCLLCGQPVTEETPRRTVPDPSEVTPPPVTR